MSIESSSFSQKWNVMISPEQEEDHNTTVFHNHVATIATVVSVIAITIITSIFCPAIAPFLIMGTVFFLGPAIELGRYFMSKARLSQKLEEQSQKVRNIYEKFVSENVSSPEIKALSFHWKQKAEEAEKEYKTLFEKAIAKEADAKPASLKKYRIEALQAEKNAAEVKLYSLFLDSLISRESTFKKLFLKYGEHLDKAIFEIGSFDPRDIETRAMSPLFSSKDAALIFHKDIQPIGYKELYQESLQESLKNRMRLAIIRREASFA